MSKSPRVRERVLILVQNLSVPFDRRVWLECQSLVDAGFRVAVVCPKAPGDPTYYRLNGVDLFKYRPYALDSALRAAPPKARIVVVGVCMGDDQVTPFWGIAKELSIHFCFGYELDEFSDTLRAIADGEVDVEPMITGEVGLDGVAQAFEDLGNPERHCKILVTT